MTPSPTAPEAPRGISVDQKSYDLAEHFLQDHPEWKGEEMKLAQAIQQAVEDWFFDKENGL